MRYVTQGEKGLDNRRRLVYAVWQKVRHTARPLGKDTIMAPSKKDPIEAAIEAAAASSVEAEGIGRRGRPKGSTDAVLAAIEDKAVEALTALATTIGGEEGAPAMGVIEAVIEAHDRGDRTQASSLVTRRTFREKVKAAGLTLGKARGVEGLAVTLRTGEDAR